MKRLLLLLPALAMAIFAITGTGGSRPVNAQDGTIVLLAGDGEPGYSVNQFLPREVTIAEGTTITWEFPWYEPHLVVFVEGAPPQDPQVTENAVWPNDQGYVYSGEVFGDPNNPPTFSVTFPEAGTYEYFCPIHPLMTATVNVVAEGGDVDTQADVDARAAAEYDANITSIKAVSAAVAARGGAVTPRPDGTKLLEVIVGSIDDAGNDGMQFYPDAANINVGDTIRWITEVPTPHTVTFNIQDAPPFDDPFALPRTPEETFGGQGFRNSGIMWTSDPSTVEYSLTFTTEGTYQYMCILHANQGMVGVVNVSAAAETPTATATATATATPKSPSTGTGTATGGDNLLLLAAVGAALVIAGGATGCATLRRR